MKAGAWTWLALLALPGCLLVQPLDDAKPKDDSGSSGKAGTGQHSGGSGPGAGGSGNKAGSGPSGGSSPVPSGGSPNGGAPSGVDFSLFLGGWAVTSAEFSRLCTNETSPTTGTIDPGEVDNFILGTQASQSDLIFVLEGMDVCDIYTNVDDRNAYGTGDQSCTVDQLDGTTTYYAYNYFEFAVSGDGQSAISTWDVSTLNSGDTSITCDSEIRARYQRTTPNN